MNCVYLVFNGETLEDPELLSVDYNFFGQARPGDFVRIKNENLELKCKIFDPQEMDLYVVVKKKELTMDEFYLDMYLKKGLLETIKAVKDDCGLGLREARDYIYKITGNEN